MTPSTCGLTECNGKPMCPRCVAMTAPPTTLEAMRALLVRSAQKFREYEALHLAKGTIESSHKALVNGCLASEIEAALKAPVDTLRERLQKKCVDMKAYWRASDAHGVELTHEQALELLWDALGVEVEIKPPARAWAGDSSTQDQSSTEPGA